MARGKIVHAIKEACFDQKTWVPILICSILMIVQYVLPFDQIRKASRGRQSIQIQSEIDSFYLDFDRNKSSFYRFSDIDENRINNLSNKNYHIQIYVKKDRQYHLTFWNKRGRFFDDKELNRIKKNKILELSEGKLFLFKAVEKLDTVKIAYLDLTELVSKYWDFKINLVDKDKEVHSFDLSIKETNKGTFYKIKDPSDSFLFTIRDLKEIKSDLSILALLAFYILESLLRIFALYNFCMVFGKKYPWAGFGILGFLLYFARWISLYYKYPSYLYNLKLFNPSLYYSPLNPSLGDLLIFIILLLILINYFSKRIFFNINKLKKYKIAWAFHTLVLAFFFGEAISIIKVFERITLNSSIWFNFNYFPRITVYSVLGLSILLLSLYNYFSLLRKALKIISKLKTSFALRALSFLSTFLLLLTLLRLTHQKQEMFVVISLLFLFFIVIYIRFINKNNRTFITNIIFIFFASTITTYLIYLYNTKKEELVLESYASNIAFGNESNFTEKIIQKIERHQPSTSHTDSSYHQNDIRLEPIEFTQYKKLLQDLSSFDSIVTPQIKCFLHKDINDRFGLVHYQNKYYRITPNSYLNSLSYNIQKNINKEIVGENFINYAKYNHDTLVMQTGQYPFNYIFNYTLNQDQTILESPDTKNFSNTVFFFDPNLKVVMSSYSTKPISPITLFSYIICFNLIAYLIFSILVNVSENLIYRKKVKIGSLSLRNRINYFIIAVIILIFTVVAVMSFSYLKSKSEEDKKEYIINKMNAVQKFLQLHRSNSETDSHISMDHLVKQLSLSNNVPVILYHFGSEFNKTTFDEKQSPKNEVDIDPMTFWMLAQKNKRSLETYYLNQKKYIEASTMLDPFDSSVHCILSIPLSSDNRVLNNDTTSFIVALVNLYVFLFIIALILSFSLSNNITSPLKTLSQKISKINIQQKNDHIEYHIDDEIGDLVKRYNSMVDEIEESAKLMANNEREDAWREMAKQIAHEIKSPLTPMKLSIQHLQRMVTEQRENSVELTKRVCETVIEQIDNLSEIATSFSNFAKINNPKLEKVDVVPILRNISDLFNNEETNSKVRFSSAVEEAAIYCDTNQLISCINNLIKNGLQAAADRDVALVDVRIFSIDNSFRISIKDNGMGVPIEIQHKIFKPNFTTKNSGTGLGLAITKKFVEAMNGTIEFNTIENVGTEFILTFAKV